MASEDPLKWQGHQVPRYSFTPRVIQAFSEILISAKSIIVASPFIRNKELQHP